MTKEKRQKDKERLEDTKEVIRSRKYFVNVLSVLLFTASHYLFGIFKLSLSFCPFSFVIVLSVLFLFTASDDLFRTFKLLFVQSEA
jgi:hypothetical protein